MMKKLDIANQRIVALESLVRKGNNSTDALMDIARKFPTRRRLSEPREGDEPTIDTSGIPEEYAISEPELRSMVRDSRNGGNFAVNLTRKLWPELFGEGNLRFNYNWYGGGQLNKQEMDPVRKEVCRKYVCFFFPEFKVEDSWRERIVSKIVSTSACDVTTKGSVVVSAAQYCPPWSQHAQMMCSISTNNFWLEFVL